MNNGNPYQPSNVQSLAKLFEAQQLKDSNNNNNVRQDFGSSLDKPTVPKSFNHNHSFMDSSTSSSHYASSVANSNTSNFPYAISSDNQNINNNNNSIKKPGPPPVSEKPKHLASAKFINHPSSSSNIQATSSIITSTSSTNNVSSNYQYSSPTISPVMIKPPVLPPPSKVPSNFPSLPIPSSSALSPRTSFISTTRTTTQPFYVNTTNTTDSNSEFSRTSSINKSSSQTFSKNASTTIKHNSSSSTSDMNKANFNRTYFSTITTSFHSHQQDQRMDDNNDTYQRIFAAVTNKNDSYIPPRISVTNRMSIYENPFETEEAILDNPFESSTPIELSPESSPQKAPPPPLAPKPVIKRPVPATVVIDKSSKRYKIVYELIQTEQNYLKDLVLLRKVYAEPIQRKALISNKDYVLIFGDLELVVSFTTDFVQVLKDMESQDLIGEAFLSKMEELEDAYFTFCLNNEASLARAVQLQQMTDDQELQSFLKKCQASLQGQTGAWDLSSFLIKPLQRLLKYPLLFKELIKNTPEDHHDLDNINQALSQIEAIAERVNDAKKHKGNVPPRVVQGISRKISRSTQQIRQITGFSAHGEIEDDNHIFPHLKEDFKKNYVVVAHFREDVISWVTSAKRLLEAQKRVAIALEHALEDDEPQIENIILKNASEYSTVTTLLYNNAYKKSVNKLKDTVLGPIEFALMQMKGIESLIKKHDRKALDYNRMMDLKKLNEPIDSRLKESVDTFIRIHDQLIKELPDFLSLTGKLFEAFVFEFNGILAEFNQVMNSEMDDLIKNKMKLQPETKFESIKSHYKNQFKHTDIIATLAAEIPTLAEWYEHLWGRPPPAQNPTRKSAPSLSSSVVRTTSETNTPKNNQHNHTPRRLSSVSQPSLYYSSQIAGNASASSTPVGSTILPTKSEYVAIYPHRAQTLDEINLQVGDVVLLVRDSGRSPSHPEHAEYWYGNVIQGQEMGKMGWFKKSFVLKKLR